MRNIWSLLFLAVLTGAAQATPSPLPPDSFAGEQYIDGRGCVFNRDGHGWTPRIDSQGKAICGFPSSLSVRRTDPDTVSVLPQEDSSAPPDAEKLLREQLAAGLRQGEFTADPHDPEPRREPAIPLGDGGMSAGIEALARQQEVIRASMAGMSPGSDLCARLGYQPDPNPRPILGGDVTQGLCPGMHATEPMERVITGQRVTEGETSARQGQHEKPTAGSVKGTDAEQAVDSGRQAKLSDTAKRPKARTSKVAASAGGSKPVRDEPVSGNAPTPRPKLIPASARYVQIGNFPDDDSAHAAIRKLAAMGFPVARGHERGKDRKHPLILAGPFNDRRSLVAALNMLRGAGYASAVAR
ncbi:SPOR domain-containing protein [Paracoccus saliphilus]|uniref:SPOR domain-containing protein n=1 Tax=Paracoccus saliphilus TaxID=405559 RepID=A0AA45W623_9RHOB|nr:SPOR domain-containing protein [Paracoccus saliphilus]WCR01600.1 SPOR domain-containing protein [Paracoccus saliphilus]SIS98865.1 Sporulation related domain-containing protein [Paracoccus saliphilus]